MELFFSLWSDMIQLWWPSWGGSVELESFLNAAETDDYYYLIDVISNLHRFTLPDYVYFIGCVLIVVLSLVALFALFKWMFTLVWRLFKID